MNVRHARKPPDVSDILPSIRARGVLQSLLVRPNGEGFEIVAGRRRYFAVIKVAEEQGMPLDEVWLPCAVAEAGDDADAIEASLIENVARAPMDELEEYEAFAKLVKEGRGVADIARTFGVTERYVKQRLALAGLHGKIKDAYRRGDIEPEDLQLLTAATRRQQKDWLAAYEAASDVENDEAEGAPRGHELRQWLFGSDQIATSAARFPIEDYKAEIITDLFGEASYFADSEAFWALQNAAACRLRDDLVGQGWQVIVLERGARFQTWKHEEAPKEEGGKVFIEIRINGEVEAHEGYRVLGERRPRNEAAGGGTEADGGVEVATKAELTKAAENYLALHRHAIVRAELRDHPAVALRLAVAHVIAGSALWSVRPEPQRAEKEAIAGSVSASPAQAAFEAERQAVLQLLDLEPGYLGTLARSNADPYWAALVFARLMALPDETVLRVLALAMAETLAAGSPLVEALGAILKPSVAQWWTTDEVFLDLVRDRAAVNAMLAEVAGQTVADANVSETAKLQKTIIRDCLAGTGRPRVDAWVPRYMAFPVSGYVTGKSFQIASHWASVSHLFTV